MPPPGCVTCSVYDVASATGFQTYAGVVDAMVPLGETEVGTAGIWPGIETSIWRAVLHALVPMALAARTNQLYTEPLASAVDGLTVHQPLAAAQFAAVAV